MTSIELVRAINRDFLDAIIRKEKSVSLKLTAGFREVISVKFKDTAEYASIINGVLRTDFGLGSYADGAIAVESIILAVEQSVTIEFEFDEDSATFEIGAFRSDFEDALGAVGAQYTSNGKNAGEVKWLSWLLFGGASVINPNYGVLNKKRKGEPYPVASSRTGFTIMRRMTQNFKRPFKVADEFQGTLGENWITRIAAASAPLLFNLIEKEADDIIAAGAGAL